MKKFILGFAIGGIVSAVAAYAYFKKRFDEKLSKELLYDIFDRTNSSKSSDSKPDNNVIRKNTDDEVASVTRTSKNMYTIKEPYCISETEYDEGTFKKISFIYHVNNDVVTEYRRTQDPDEVVVKNPKEILGIDVYEEFQNSDNSIIFIRDEVKKIDYEVMLSLQDFSTKKKVLPPNDDFEEDEISD